MSTKTLLATAVTATVLMGPALAMAEMRIGITQNNVGVDSYQTTYESAFIAAAEANDEVRAVVLDAGGDVARQIAQVDSLIQQEVDAIIIWLSAERIMPVSLWLSPTPTLQSRGLISFGLSLGRIT